MLTAIAAIAPLRIPERNTGIQASVCVPLVGVFTPIMLSKIPPSNITTSSENLFHTAYDARAALAVLAQGSASIVRKRIFLVTDLGHC
jgi:hypothetical protein